MDSSVKNVPEYTDDLEKYSEDIRNCDYCRYSTKDFNKCSNPKVKDPGYDCKLLMYHSRDGWCESDIYFRAFEPISLKDFIVKRAQLRKEKQDQTEYLEDIWKIFTKSN